MLNTLNGNGATLCIDDEFANELKNYRENYHYPKAFIERVDAQPYDIQIAENFFASYRAPLQNQVTDKWLDSYHHSLLTSKDGQEQLLGLASVVYWGLYTFGDAYSGVRVQRLVDGHGKYPPTTANAVADRIGAMSNFINQGNAGSALGALSGTSQLNYTSLASKVVAFLAPSIAGVYDKRIRSGLADEPWAGHIRNGARAVSSPSVQNSYQSWCLFLSLVSSQLNFGIRSGRDWCWSCGEDLKQSWRALDVERALYVKYGNEA